MANKKNNNTNENTNAVESLNKFQGFTAKEFQGMTDEQRDVVRQALASAINRWSGINAGPRFGVGKTYVFDSVAPRDFDQTRADGTEEKVSYIALYLRDNLGNVVDLSFNSLFYSVGEKFNNTKEVVHMNDLGGGIDSPETLFNFLSNGGKLICTGVKPIISTIEFDYQTKSWKARTKPVQKFIYTFVQA